MIAFGAGMNAMPDCMPDLSPKDTGKLESVEHPTAKAMETRWACSIIRAAFRCFPAIHSGHYRDINTPMQRERTL